MPKSEMMQELTFSKHRIQECVSKAGSTDHVFLRPILADTFSAAIREVDRLQEHCDDLEYCCLHLRNIFELFLILKHISSSEDGFKSWMGQMYQDLTDIHVGFAALLEGFGRDTSDIDISQSIADAALAKTNFAPSRPFVIRELAEQFGYLEEYRSIHKFCSKFVHPTSLRINGFRAIKDNDDFRMMAFYLAVVFTQRFEELSIDLIANDGAQHEV